MKRDTELRCYALLWRSHVLNGPSGGNRELFMDILIYVHTFCCSDSTSQVLRTSYKPFSVWPLLPIR